MKWFCLGCAPDMHCYLESKGSVKFNNDPDYCPRGCEWGSWCPEDDDDDRVTIKCTEKQLSLIRVCVETMSRIACGEVSELINGLDLIADGCREGVNSEGEVIMGYALGQEIKKRIKPLLFPELKPGESYGVGNEKIGDGQVLYEMYKKIDNYFATKYNQSLSSVAHHPPLHYSKEPLIEINDLT